MRKVSVKTLSGATIEVPHGMRIYDVLQHFPEHFPLADEGDFIVATMNNELVSLSDALVVNGTLVPIPTSSSFGAGCYRQSLVFLLGMAWARLYPHDNLTISLSHGYSYYFYLNTPAKKPKIKDVKVCPMPTVPSTASVAGLESDCLSSQVSRTASDLGGCFIPDFSISEEVLSALRQMMEDLVAKNLPIVSNFPMNSEDAIRYFEAIHDFGATALLKSLNETRVQVAKCEEYIQLSHQPISPVTSLLRYFDLVLYKDGFVMCFPEKSACTRVVPFRRTANDLLYDVYTEYSDWIRVMNIHVVGHINMLVYENRIKSFIQICESMSHKKYSEICDIVVQGRAYFRRQLEARRQKTERTGLFPQYPEMRTRRSPLGSSLGAQTGPPLAPPSADQLAVEQCACPDPDAQPTGILKSALVGDNEIKVICISGPFSAGKATFATKLAYNLKLMGHTPLQLPIEDYYTGASEDPDTQASAGLSEFDVELFNEHLRLLLKGEAIAKPRRGCGCSGGAAGGSTEHLTMPYRGIIILQGIHALNPVLTSSVRIENKFNLFIGPFTSINLDDRTRLSSRDVRTLRRIVGGSNFKARSAEETLGRKAATRRCEDTWVYPHQQRADLYFNTALDYELHVLATHAIPLLSAIKPSSDVYVYARKLLKLLSRVTAINSEYVPKYSILREFIGGSAFDGVEQA